MGFSGLGHEVFRVSRFWDVWFLLLAFSFGVIQA